MNEFTVLIHIQNYSSGSGLESGLADIVSAMELFLKIKIKKLCQRLPHKKLYNSLR
jgi:hypothetical protein